MYFYLLDPHGQSIAEFERQKVQLAGLTHEFNISGETSAVNSIRTISDIIKAATRKQIRTLVVCGSDDTFNRVLTQLPGTQFTIGFVPLVGGSQLSGLLGINTMRDAVKILAARRLAVVDAASINSAHFFSYLEFGLPSQQNLRLRLWNRARLIPIKARIDNQYILEASSLGGLIVNARGHNESNAATNNPTDGWLNLDLLPNMGRLQQWRLRTALEAHDFESVPKTSSIPIKTIELIEPVGLPLTMLGRQIARVPATIKIIPHYLQLIVGKARTFSL